MQTTTACPLCVDAACIWRNSELRVIDADAAGYPGYTRVIWNAHVAEMTQLDANARERLMRAVWTVEQTLRDSLEPAKINLAEFGNQVPHLHWHIIPRWSGDMQFPNAIWAEAVHDAKRRAAWDATEAQLQARLPSYHAALRNALDVM